MRIAVVLNLTVAYLKLVHSYHSCIRFRSLSTGFYKGTQFALFAEKGQSQNKIDRNPGDSRADGGPRRRPANIISRKSGSSSSSSQDAKLEIGGVRLNKCLQGLSRRGADDAIAEQRVTINGNIAKNGDRVEKRDVVRLDGKIQHWEGVALAKKVWHSMILQTIYRDHSNFRYSRYYF
jgi:ribosomal 50S subunit-recycling heat shock protein